MVRKKTLTALRLREGRLYTSEGHLVEEAVPVGLPQFIKVCSPIYGEEYTTRTSYHHTAGRWDDSVYKMHKFERRVNNDILTHRSPEGANACLLGELFYTSDWLVCGKAVQYYKIL
jgi:hypothetical protein